MRVGSNKLPCAFLLLLFLYAVPTLAQTTEQLLELGQKSYEFDKKDSAEYYFEQAYQQEGPNTKLKAVTGLLKVALLRSETAASDSLIELGESLRSEAIDKSAIFPFEIWKGEYYKKKSELSKALEQQKAVVKQTSAWDAKSTIHADALFYTALTFERLTEYDSSIAYIEQAYQLYKQNLDTTATKFAEIYNGLGNSYYRKNDFQKSKHYYLKSKEISEQNLGPVSSDLAVVLGNLSSISRTEENYQEAIEYSEQSLKIFKALDDQKGISVSYYSLGVFYYFLGDYGRTKDYMEACIALREELYHPMHYALINPYEVMGIALEESGNYEQTLFYLSKVRPIIKENFGEASLQEGLNSENTAICFQKVGELDSAWHYVQIAHEILIERLNDNAYQLGTHHFTYADILREKGEYDKARASIETSNKIYENLGMANSSEYAQSLTMLAIMAAQEGDWEKGDSYFSKALAIIKDSEKDSSIVMMPNNLVILNEYISYLYEEYQTLGKEESLEAFQNYSNQYLSISENLRKQFIDPYTKSVLIKDNAQLYNTMIGAYFHLYGNDPQEAYLNELYQFSEYGRAALLRDMQDEKIIYYAGIPDSLIQKENSLKIQIGELNQKLIEGDETDEHKKQFFEAKEALSNHITYLANNYPEYHALKFNTKIQSLKEIQEKLETGQNLVEYMQDDTSYYALLVSAQMVKVANLGKIKAINKAITDWKEGIVNQDVSQIRTNGHSLYNSLWKPIEKDIQGEKVIIVPVGPLFYLNIESFSKTADKDDFLIYDYTISYALSFNTYFSDNEESGKGNIISIAPGFEEELKVAYQENIDTLETLDQDYLKTVRQPWTVKLAKTLEEKFSNTTYVGGQATESNIKKDINEAGILYFGTHAIANELDPMRSKLVLAKEVGEQNEDGYLHAYELFGIQLNAELAVLNACESGLGGIQTGEGMISLAYSMHFAGCPSTVMSLWKIDEKVNTQITEAFFDNLAEGMAKSEALRTAKLAYLKEAKGNLKSPFYWSGLVLMGKDDTLEMTKSSFRNDLLLIFILLGVIVAYFIFRKRFQRK